MSRLRRQRGAMLDPWPGYVDALSTLLMVIIFVLLVFVLAQAFLGVAISNKDAALERLNQQLSELSELLNLERGQAQELRGNLARTAEELRGVTAARDALVLRLRGVEEQRDRATAERDGIRTERDRLTARVADLELAARSSAERLAALDQRLAEARTRAERADEETTRTQARVTEATRLLESERNARLAAERSLAELQAQLEAMRREMATLDRQVRVDRETIEMRLSELANLSRQLAALTALRDDMERRLREQGAARTAAEANAQEATRLSESARAQVAVLNRQIEELRAQLGRISAALDLAESQGRDKDAQIANLGQRLNTALAAQVENLQRYRSDFFGRLREVLGNRPEIRVVGDRFVFQSEVLFPAGSAELSEAGQAQIRRVGVVLRDISRRIPPDVNWVLRVDGHADKVPINNQRFASNWELSAARAIAVARLLVQEGLPATRVAPTAFGENQPLDNAEGPEAYARNRRIEFRLTDR